MSGTGVSVGIPGYSPSSCLGLVETNARRVALAPPRRHNEWLFGWASKCKNAIANKPGCHQKRDQKTATYEASFIKSYL